LVNIKYLLISTTAGREQDVYKRLGSMKEVSEVVMVSGEYDILVKVRTGGAHEAGNLVKNRINEIPGVAEIHLLSGKD